MVRSIKYLVKLSRISLSDYFLRYKEFCAEPDIEKMRYGLMVSVRQAAPWNAKDCER